LPFQIAFLLGTAIALAFVVAALVSARPAHAAGTATPTTAAATTADSSSSSGQSKLQAAVSTDASGSGDQAGWVQYGVFALAFGAMVVIGTGLVPRRRS